MLTDAYLAHIAAHPDLPDDPALRAEEAALIVREEWTTYMRIVRHGGHEQESHLVAAVRALERAVRGVTGWLSRATWSQGGKGRASWLHMDWVHHQDQQVTVEWTDDNDLPARVEAALMAMRAWVKEQG